MQGNIADAGLRGFDVPTPTPSVDLVNHPPHYKAGGIEVIDFIEAKGLNYRLGNVVKYVARAGLKGAALQDLKKARWYLNREIDAIVTEAEARRVADTQFDRVMTRPRGTE